jgi:hypothetical protein
MFRDRRREGMMKASRKLNRRSFVASVGGGVLIGGGAAGLVLGRAEAQNIRYSGVTDCDSGANHDNPGYGTGNRNQYTDSDSGANADPRCHGHGPNGRPEGSVSGNGRYGDAVSGCSDSDGGPGSDPGGRGVRCNGQTPPRRYPPGETRHCTDSDRGGSADPVQQGRHC